VKRESGTVRIEMDAKLTRCDWFGPRLLSRYSRRKRRWLLRDPGAGWSHTTSGRVRCAPQARWQRSGT